ncbi:ABC transporter substrate-binding protein [Halosolutus gelatinilyticus]|uniref:ABC transporter substrate-binding protein n=1 Tax=Halosolutus gelatinilyticus TaxID=2931975 RepID=UPI001FF67C5D|nr:ABC transporter substrate-binding protein [Halosolutus gelatinilyticus]
MNRDSTTPVDGVSRRSVLAAGAAGLTLSTSGCIDRVQSVVDDEGTEQLSISILTVPADGDRENVQLARHLEENLEAVGVDVSIDMRSRSEVLETVLIEHDFDCYVGTHPTSDDPDFLYEALHSTYASEAGWQNPFGFTSIAFDALLEEQRRTDGEARRRNVGEVLNALAQEKPFDPICVPDAYRIARTDRFEGWDGGHLGTRHGYLGLKPTANVDRLHALLTDSRPSRNVNPLSAPYRDQGPTIGLLYDSLVTVRDGSYEPWLAESWEWREPDENATENELATATIALREGCVFHDGEPVTARDVAFTYRFLGDTALGRANAPSPAPRYRSHAAAIERVKIEGDHRLTIGVSTGTEAGTRALAVPILPKHRWEAQVLDRSDGGDFSAPQGEWGLVTMDNLPPTGSGPYRYADHAEREHLTLVRFEDHFTRRENVDQPEAPVEELRFTVDPGSKSSIKRIDSGDADVTASRLGAHAIVEIPDGSDLTRLESPSQTFYLLGFNTRTSPFSNSHFRRAVAQLLDKASLVENVFDDHARPLATPVSDEWTPEELAWNGQDPVTPFFGTDGELDVERARRTFEGAGFRYDDRGRLLSRH